MRRFLAVAAALMLGSAISPAGAQNYPTQPIRLIVPFAPGGGSDTLGRITAEALSTRLGQPILVENRAGAGSAIGIDLAAKSKPDGYTILWTPSDGVSILPAVKASVPYKVPDDFSFIARLTQLPLLIGINAKLPINTVEELIAYAKANPGKLRYGTPGVGSGPHMAAVLFAKTAGIDMVHIPYGGTGPAMTALVGGFIDATVASPSSLKPQADAGNVRVVATMGADRHLLYPNVPSLRESGVPLDLSVFYGLMAPAGVPEPILAKLRTETSEMLKDPKMIERLKSLGYKPEFLGGDDFKNHVAKEFGVWKDVAKSANISISD